eukprot:COSAG01_NODE_34324_length_549_cov_1.664444_1_plen_99_part_10
MMLRSLIILAAGSAPESRVAATMLSSNPYGSPQELKAINATVCHNRSQTCSVLFDVPVACAGDASDCPIAMLFHQHGGHNTKFVHLSPSVFDYNMIGVY